MESPTSVTTENLEPRGKGGACSKGIPVASTADIDAAYSDEQPSRGPWLSETPPTGVLTGVLGEMSYYGAYGLYHRLAPPRREKMR